MDKITTQLPFKHTSQNTTSCGLRILCILINRYFSFSKRENIDGLTFQPKKRTKVATRYDMNKYDRLSCEWIYRDDFQDQRGPFQIRDLTRARMTTLYESSTHMHHLDNHVSTHCTWALLGQFWIMHNTKTFGRSEDRGDLYQCPQLGNTVTETCEAIASILAFLWHYLSPTGFTIQLKSLLNHGTGAFCKTKNWQYLLFFPCCNFLIWT